MFPAGRSHPSSLDLLERLRDPRLYAAAAERLRAQQLARDSVRSLGGSGEGPFLPGVGDLSDLGRALAREVGSLRYALGPVRARRVLIRGQRRTLHVAQPLDEIVLSALAAVLGEHVEPFVSPRVFSYRRGRSALQAITEWLAYVRAHRRDRGDRRDWGLYVLRRDVRGYGEAIPAGEASRLWALLAEALSAGGRPASAPVLAWLRSAFRPALETDDGSRSVPLRGIPTGSPLQPAACNLYLAPLDRLLGDVPGAFYARYGDDMLFAHPDPGTAGEVARELDRLLASLELEWSADKCGDLFYNLAGRGPAAHAASFRGVAALDYLGFRIDFHGVLGLKRSKLRRLLADLGARLEASEPLLRELAPASRARDVCAVVNAALDPDHASASAAASALRYLVSDRAQLRDLDYKIALLVAQRLSARRGVRAFRDYPPGLLRGELGLRSLVRARDRNAPRPAAGG